MPVHNYCQPLSLPKTVTVWLQLSIIITVVKCCTCLLWRWWLELFYLRYWSKNNKTRNIKNQQKKKKNSIKLRWLLHQHIRTYNYLYFITSYITFCIQFMSLLFQKNKKTKNTPTMYQNCYSKSNEGDLVFYITLYIFL